MKNKEIVKDYETRMHTSDLLIKELNKKITSLMEGQKDLEKEKDKLKEAYREYCSGILQEYTDSLRTLSSEFTKVIDHVTSFQKNIVDPEFFDEFEAEIEMKDVKKIETEDEKIDEEQEQKK